MKANILRYAILNRAVFVIIIIAIAGCAASNYERTREQGTREYDVGEYHVRSIGKDLFRVTYTEYEADYNNSRVKSMMLRRAAELGKEKGYVCFTVVGEGRTGRQGIVMQKMVVRFYSDEVKNTSQGTWNVEKLLADESLWNKQ